jgi:hypothetical protein
VAEGYVRPPLVAREPTSRRAAIWRLRLIALAVVVALAVLIVVLVQSHTPGDNQNPGIGLGPVAAAQPVDS